mgnify:CR=1 FL=1
MVKDREILSTEEQLGLSKEQIQQLKDKSLSKEERIEVAVLLLNETYSCLLYTSPSPRDA